MFYRKHERVTVHTGDIEITKQSFKAECDINTILKQYQRTGVISHVQSARPTYADLPSDLDYQQSMNTLIIARDAFDGLPATVRARFGNDPEQFLAAFGDEKQADYLREVGLLKPKASEPEAAASAAPVPASS